MPRAQAKVDVQLAQEVAKYYADPLGFVAFAYPWGEPGVLRDATGPDTWQRETLIAVGAEVRARAFDGVDPVAPIRMAATAGALAVVSRAWPGWRRDLFLQSHLPVIRECRDSPVTNDRTEKRHGNQ